MSDNKVIWSEGMFLRHQHFQQQDRYVEHLVDEMFAMVNDNTWGLKSYTIDQQHLALDRFALLDCRGVFPDGTTFNTNEDCDPPAFLHIPDDVHGGIVYLGVPLRGADMLQADSINARENLARYTAIEEQVRDTTDERHEAAPIHVGRLRLQLLMEHEDRSQFATIAVARIIEAHGDRGIVLDEEFIPPCLSCKTSYKLTSYLTELHALLQHRAEDLAGRVAQPTAAGLARMTDFLLLQLANRYESLISYFAQKAFLHPQRLYEEFLKLMGELATYTNNQKRLLSYPMYDHENLQATFGPIMTSLRQSLGTVLEQNVIPLDLQESKQGIKVALLTDRNLIKTARFILAVKADVATETVRTRFPAQSKIAPVEKIRSLISSQLPGISLISLPVPPQELPYHAGFCYFELDKHSQIWASMANSSGFAFHLSGDFPALQLEFWAIIE